jgi:hypothetical protein
MYTKFLYWRYDPMGVLASSMGLLHWFLSSALVFQSLNPRILKTFFALPSHRRLGLPALLVPPGFEKASFLYGDISSALVRCPSHMSLFSLTILTISGRIISRIGEKKILKKCAVK